MTFVTIGTGGISGVYYPTGSALSRMLNKKIKKYNIKATVESTSGSVYNIDAVLNKKLQFGIAQADRQYQAYHGEGEWKNKGPQKSLRSILSIHPEIVTLVVSRSSQIQTIQDLVGKRINLGNQGSGQLGNSRDILKLYQIKETSLQAKYAQANQVVELLHDNKIDGFFYTVGHPNNTIRQATTGNIDVKLIPLVGKEIDQLVEQYPYYSRSVIPIRLYLKAKNTEDVDSFGVKATLITSINVHEKVVYALTKEVFENLDEFKALHDAYQTLTKEGMLEGLSIPLHPGALKYYQEAGLTKYIDSKLM